MLIKVYVARAWRRNKDKLNSPETAEVIKLYGANQITCKSSSCFCMVFVFASKQSRDMFVQQMGEKARVSLFSDKQECYIDKNFFNKEAT